MQLNVYYGDKLLDKCAFSAKTGIFYDDEGKTDLIEHEEVIDFVTMPFHLWLKYFKASNRARE